MWNKKDYNISRANRIHGIRYLEFLIGENSGGDTTYTFHPIGEHSTNRFNEYTTIITINELSEDLDGSVEIIRTECDCNAFKHFKKDCKHIKDARKLLNEYGIKTRNIPLNRYWCTLCKREAQISEVFSNTDTNLCYHCLHKMNKAKNEQREKDKEKE